MLGKLVKFYLRVTGQRYLRGLLAPLIRKINDMSFEVVICQICFLGIVTKSFCSF